MDDYLVPPERLAGDGFVVRSWMPGDGPALAAAIEASYAHLAPWLAWPRTEEPRDEAERRVRGFRAAWLRAEDFTLAVLDPTERQVLGGSGFHLRHGPLAARQAEIGMWIHADDAGRGLGTRVLVALLAWGFDAWPWERLVWRCDSRNTASRRTAERAGLVHEGTARHEADEHLSGRRDTLQFAALRGVWAPPAAAA